MYFICLPVCNASINQNQGINNTLLKYELKSQGDPQANNLLLRHSTDRKFNFLFVTDLLRCLWVHLCYYKET